MCSASWRSWAFTVATKMAQFLFPGIGAFYNIIKSSYGTSPDTDSYGLNLGSDLTSDQDREITDILRRRVLILSRQSFTFLNFLRNLKQTIFEELGILRKHGVKNKQSHMHISQWVILINEQIKVGAHKK